MRTSEAHNASAKVQRSAIKMPAASVMTVTETHNFTQMCNWFSEQNLTEPHEAGQLDPASCIFLSILPHGNAVPALVSIFVLLTIFSFLVNGLTLFCLGRSEDLSWEPRFTFLKNLILSDLMQTVTFGPAIIHSLIRRQTMAFNTWCNVQYFVGTASIFSSLVTITCMALERYLYVCHAIRYLVILTTQRIRVALSFIWVYSLSVSTVNMVLLHTGRGQENEQVTRGLLCEPDMVEQYMGFPRASAAFRKVMGSCTLLLCLLVYAFSYLKMYREARNAVIPFNTVNTTARRTVVFYCGMLFLQLLPLLLKVISDALWEVEGIAEKATSTQDVHEANRTQTTRATVFHMSLLIMLIVPPCINPLVYGLRNREMRQALPGLLWRWCRVEGVRNVAPNLARAG